MDRTRRSLTISVAAGAVFLFMVLLVVAWFAVTQPMLPDRPDGPSPKSADPARLLTHVSVLTNDFLPRNWEHPDNLSRAAEYIHDRFADAGGIVTYQPIEMDHRFYRNVIARFGPDGQERIVVGAHYDVYEDFPGADDNASGVGGLIELAHLFGSAPPPVGVELVAYALGSGPIKGIPFSGEA